MKNGTKTITPGMVVMLLVFVVAAPFLPLLISWRWNWWEAWVFAIISISGFVISRYLAGRRHPELLVERGQYLQNTNPEPWDKYLSPISAWGGIPILIVAGLNMRLGSSTHFGSAIKTITIFLMLCGYALGSYALIVNHYFSGMVRIQSERGHHVINIGPYRWVRHPGYAGAMITYLSMPFLLDSWWALIPVLFLLIIIFLRTYLEDQFLQEKLPGYTDYSQQVPYRLIPWVW
jgi:protein-S-isoprenylcysteine O-methyltransferase Ste14